MTQASPNHRKTMWQVLMVLAVFFVFAAVYRPLLPIDETRYMTVAWEMWLNHDYAVLSLNFAPYHHKPPLLFWLINASWEAFGVSRAAGMVPVFLAAFGFVWLTRRLTAVLLPGDDEAVERATWITLGSAPFIIYSSLIMFDIMMACFVMGVLLCYLAYARGGKWYLPVFAGLLMGLGVLTKGPVVYLYTLWPLLLYPFWRPDVENSPSKGKWYFMVLLSVLVSAGPVLAWLYPTAKEADGNFLKWLIWRQTAGRVTGNFKSAHARPFYFYLMLLPVLTIPWVFYRSFRTGLCDLRAEFGARREFRFLLCWILPVFLSFCAISGKQPHYLVPLLPGLYVIYAWMFTPVSARSLRTVALFVVGILIAAHPFMKLTVLKPYDLQEVADFVAARPDTDWAYVRKYQGELGFLGRIDFPLESIEMEEADDWFAAHPDGMLITRRVERMEKRHKYDELMLIPYRSRRLGIYKLSGATDKTHP